MATMIENGLLLNCTGADVDEAVQRFKNGWIEKPTEHLKVTQNILDEKNPLDILKYATLNVEVPTGVFPIGALIDSLITRSSDNYQHKAAIPADYYVENDFTISEWKSGQIQGSATNGKAFQVPYSSIGFIPTMGIAILNSGSVATNAMICFFTIPAGSRYIYRTSSGVSSATSLQATFDSNGMSFPTANSTTAYTKNNYRWFALR